MRRRTWPTTRFVQQPRRDELVAMSGLEFEDGEEAVVRGADSGFPHVSLADGRLSREYTWEMVDRLVSLGVRFPFDKPPSAQALEVRHADAPTA